MKSDLVDCRVCGRPVSKAAPVCPGCGDATARRYGLEPRQKTSPWTIIGWIILILLAIPLVTCMGVLSNTPA